jgi:NAD(P)-dependent dehydrogenase (short-subunit alcohol dehydrogenase family)
MELPQLQKVLDLNIVGTILPSQVFSEVFAKQRTGVIINISSNTAQRPLTQVVGYSSAKAAIDNFTKWLAVELASKYGEGIRVNAIAPGFFIGEQNRNLLLTQDGSLTPRGEKIIEHTPMGRFGTPEDMDGVLLFLCSEMSKFVTGVVINVDGGFGATSV